MVTVVRDELRRCEVDMRHLLGVQREMAGVQGAMAYDIGMVKKGVYWPARVKAMMFMGVDLSNFC